MNLTWCYLKPYSTRGVLYVVLVVLSVVATMATALSVSDFLKILFGSEAEEGVPSVGFLAQVLDGLYAWLMTFGRRTALVLFSVIVFVLYGLKNVFGYLSIVQMSVIKTRVVRDIRDNMFAKAMRLPLSYYDRHKKGDVLSRMSCDMAEYEEGVLGSVQSLLASVISLVLYLAMLIYINVKLTLFVLCMLPIVALVVSGLSHHLKRASKKVQEMNAHLISLTDETMGGLKVIKAYTAIEFSNRRFVAYNRRYTRLRNGVYMRVSAASPISEFLSNVIVVGILLFGAMLVMNGDNGLTAEMFISYVMLFVLMIPPAKDLTTAISQIKKGQACATRISDFLAEEEEPYEERKTQATTDRKGSEDNIAVEFQHVSFAYVEGTPVVNDVSFKIERGKTLAIVGASGSGKSTIADLICRFYDNYEGKILLDGTDVKAMTLGELRERIGVVAQETLLFNASVAENIAFGHPEASREEIEAAAMAANAHEFIQSLPAQYETNIGDGGSALSGGQRQRISIARALLCKPDLFILDEATSALDTESERSLQKTLTEVIKGHTAIMIAHRLSTIQGADAIAVLDGGRIVEWGTHKELMDKGGRYAEMIALQSI
ncbi:MAG: ABC transporter ATP-binding protein [Bacteroidales bacterium]|nr:ABC transporter ATP-binding protein [Bacteroidales bacterium]